MGFLADPSTQTVAAVQAIRSQVTPNTFQSLLSGAKAIEGGGKSAQQAAALHDSVNYWAASAGIHTNPQTLADKQAWLTLNSRVSQRVGQLQADKGTATPEQVDSIIKNEVVRQTLSQLRGPQSYPSPPVPQGHGKVEQWGRDKNGRPVRIQ